MSAMAAAHIAPEKAPSSTRKTGDGVPASLAKQPTNPLWQAMAMGVQAKLAVSSSDDPSEREADRIADNVIRMPVPRVQRKCKTCGDSPEPCPNCEEEIQRKASPNYSNADDHGVGDDFASRLSMGAPLADDDREFFESRMGFDFAGVRIHTDASANSSAQSIGARAYTLGSDIAFADGEYQPSSNSGRQLLAHELTHVVQQQHAPRAVQRAPGPHEAEIERSKVSPGRVTGSASPPAFSVYNFAINESTLKDSHREFLDELADLIKTGVIKNVRLKGHTDSTGDDVINGPLANDRAAAVETYLVTAGGAVTGISAAGSTVPVAPNSTEWGRSRNRRVDITYEIVGIKIPPPKGKDPDPPPKPPDGGTPPPIIDPPPDFDFDFPCIEHPIICGIIGVGVFCLFFPEICAAGIPWPDIPWPDWPDWPDDDDPKEPDEPDEPEEPEDPDHQCGDPEMPPTHVDFIPASGDKGAHIKASPLTRCPGNTTGSEPFSDPDWPHGWDCVVDSGETNLWVRAHLLHHELHGPGDDRRNIIISDKSINGLMYRRVERDAVSRVWDHNEVLWYEVEVNHFTGAYPRPYFAESVDMSFGTMDPITGVESSPLVTEHITSNSSRVPPQCTPDPPTDTDPPDEDDDTPVPDDDTPVDPSTDDSPCDQEELARRVDACVEEAEQGAIECTAGLNPLGGGWGGVGEGIEYYLCLDQVRKRLLDCDKKAKEDTHCPDSPAPDPEGPEDSEDSDESDDSFDSTLQICHHLLNSRVFNVTDGTVEVDIDANWLDANGVSADADACPMTEYHVSLEQVGFIVDSEIGTGDATVGTATRFTWNNLEAGQYYLTIWTNNDNPECCLTGTVSVNLPRTA